MASQQNTKYYDLGKYSRDTTTTSTDASLCFNRGLIWSYAFNHEEAVKCFENAINYDPDCAMAFWGLAYSLGPNYNKPWESFDQTELLETVSRTHQAVLRAEQIAVKATAVEQALIHALRFRYPKTTSEGEDPGIWNKEYAEAMELVYKEYRDDLDVAALCADALMNLTPWSLWDLQSGEPAEGARTLDIKRILDHAMSLPGGMNHPGVLHLYIHLMEMSTTPEAAQGAADCLCNLVPDAGHLNHMPTHIDILLGNYSQAVKSNQMAIKADEKFLAQAGPANFYSLYRMHDYHFCIYAAMFSGKLQVALDTVARLDASLSENLLRLKSPPMADWLEAFAGIRLHVLVRFGRWQDIIDFQQPHDSDLFCVTVSTSHYAKAVAFAATNRINEAEEQRELFMLAVRKIPASRTLFNNKCIDILGVAEEMMKGEISYRRGDYEDAFAHLRTAIARDDALPYDEPWGWMQPTRHAYGALLMEQGHFEEASGCFSQDLGLGNELPRALRHPNNVWALHGYHECMVRLQRIEEAASVEPLLKDALQHADVPIKAACFCRLR